MSTAHDSTHSVVVGFDGSKHALVALDWAATEASSRGARLTVLEACSPDYPSVRSAGPGEPVPPQPNGAVASAVVEGCEAAAERARSDHPELDVVALCEEADPGVAIVGASATASLVVVGARGLGRMRQLLLGSVSSYVAPRSHCPVVVIHERPSRSLSDLRVVVGVDGSASSTAVLHFAFDMAQRRGWGVTAVHVWDLDLEATNTAASLTWSVDWSAAEEQEQVALAEAVAGFAAEYPTVDVRRYVVRGRPVAELARQSENAALLVVGTRGRKRLSAEVLGSVSRRLLHDARCPVAVIPPARDADRSAGTSVHHRFHLPVPPVREPL